MPTNTHIHPVHHEAVNGPVKGSRFTQPETHSVLHRISQGIEVVLFKEEFTTTSKLYAPTYSQIKGDGSEG